MPNQQNSFFDDDLAKRKQKKQRVTMFFLFVFGAFLIFTGFRGLKNQIYNPFNLSGEDKKPASVVDLGTVNTDLLMETDTDGDGLSDYQELYIYNTSPYLVDTDSDGFSDYEEVMVRGTDPLCGEGQDCSVDSFIAPDIKAETEISSSSIDNTNGGLPSIENAIIDGEINPSFLRELLLSNGLNEDDVRAISDEDLKKIYYEIVAENSPMGE